MGLFAKILRNMPGSPKSIAKNLSTHYKNDANKYPNLTPREIYRQLLGSRYSILKTANKGQINKIVDESNSLVDVTICVVAIENPAAVSPTYIRDTYEDILKYFSEENSEEYAKFVADLFPNRKKALPNPSVLANVLTGTPAENTTIQEHLGNKKTTCEDKADDNFLELTVFGTDMEQARETAQFIQKMLDSDGRKAFVIPTIAVAEIIQEHGITKLPAIMLNHKVFSSELLWQGSIPDEETLRGLLEYR